MLAACTAVFEYVARSLRLVHAGSNQHALQLAARLLKMRGGDQSEERDGLKGERAKFSLCSRKGASGGRAAPKHFFPTTTGSTPMLITVAGGGSVLLEWPVPELAH